MAQAQRQQQLQEIQLRGVLERVRYHQSNFLIGILADRTVVKGEMIAPQVGLEYAFTGSWKSDPKWGDQFAFSDYEAQYPTSVDAINDYLVETCKWMGPATAIAVTSAYGAATLEVLKTDPSRVAAEIQGLTLARAQEIAAALRNNEEVEKLRIELKEMFGGTKITKRAANKVIDIWGKDAPAIVRQNPYCMIERIPGVGFVSADEVALKIGYDRMGGPRVQAAVEHVLRESAWNGGHVYLTRRVLTLEAAQLLAVPADRVEEELPAMERERLIYCLGDAVFLKKFRDDELEVAEKIRELVQYELPPGAPDHSGLADDQVVSVDLATRSGVFILTGAPGTGKTFTIKRIISSFPGVRVELAAPTGKAAKRMSEQTGIPAQTVHRLLGPEKVEGGFRFTRGQDHPIEADLVVVDEFSMMDISLTARLLSAVALGTRLILVGDTYQLPAVGPGNVLKDLIACGQVPSVELTVIKRQDPGLIITNCHRVKNGESIQVDNDGARDFFHLERETEEEIRETVLDLVTRRLPEAYDINPLRDAQVIVPVREKGPLSCKAFNEAFQARLFPGEGRFRVGDKVINTKNNYDLELMNGDIGFIDAIDPKRGYLQVMFDSPERLVEISLKENDLQLAYAVTCHKYQGSESRVIVLPIHKGYGSMILQRSWVYTAISRAREVCIVVGQSGELAKAIRRNQVAKRNTKLQELLA